VYATTLAAARDLRPPNGNARDRVDATQAEMAGSLEELAAKITRDEQRAIKRHVAG
jgi:hypothetical protein